MKERVLEALSKVKDPEIGKDLVSLGMVKDVRVDGNDVALQIELTTPACPLKDKIAADIEAALPEFKVASRMSSERGTSGALAAPMPLADPPMPPNR